jgi:hypothetical protein
VSGAQRRLAGRGGIGATILLSRRRLFAADAVRPPDSGSGRGIGCREGGAAAAHPGDLRHRQAAVLQVALQLDPLLSALAEVTRLPVLLLVQLKFDTQQK